MYPKVLHIYGPIWINSYGLMITIGIFVFLYLLLKDPDSKKVISKDDLSDVILFGVFSAIVGGRILFVIENTEIYSNNWIEVLYPWAGGFSSMGSVIAVLLTVPFFLIRRGVKILKFLDLVGIHVPIINGFGRIGCFLAGCCHGALAHGHSFAIYYTHPESMAPLNVPLFPTQLVESFFSFLIFFILRFFLSKRFTAPGQMICAYLVMISSVRFVVEFWRGDWECLQESFLTSILPLNLSFSHFVTAGVFSIGLIGFLYFGRNK